MSHADYSALTLDQAKVQARQEVEDWYGSAGEDVYDSAAKGVVYRYYAWPSHTATLVALSSAESGKGVAGQLMSGVVPTNPDGTLITDQDPVYGLVWHTAREVKGVHADYAKFIAKIQAKREEFLLQIHNATEVAAMEQLVELLHTYRVA